MDEDHERDIELLRRRLEREREARRQAEDIAEAGMRRLYLQTQTISVLAHVADVANHSSTLRDAIGESLPIVAALASSTVGHAFLCRPDGTLESSGVWHEEGAGASEALRRATAATEFRSGSGLPGQVVATGRPEWIEDVGQHPGFLRAEAQPGLAGRSAFALPVVLGDEVVAVLEFFGSYPMPPDRDLLDAAAQIGVLLGRVVERERALAEVTAMNERLEARVADRTAELDAARAVAEAASQSKSEALANLGHELRTPLTAVLGMIDLAITTGVSPEVEADLLVALRAARTLRGQVDRLLTLADLEARRLTLHSETVDLGVLLDAVVEVARPAAESKGLSISLAIDPGTPPTLTTDRARLEMALRALVDNAVKFTDHGGVTVRAGMASRPATDRRKRPALRIEVDDTGVGLADGDASRLTQSFVTGDPSPSRTHPGVGIGLAIASRVLALLGARLGAEGNPSGGTTFWADLPIGPAEGPNPAGGDATQRVLLVEDNDVNRRITGAYLGRLGLAHDSVVNGAEAVEAIRTGSYGLVLMDLQMPVMDGYEATAKIRALEHPRREVPILALTASATAGDRERCLAAGMNDYLAKPFDREDLRRLVEPWLGRSTGADATRGSMPPDD